MHRPLKGSSLLPLCSVLKRRPVVERALRSIVRQLCPKQPKPLLRFRSSNGLAQSAEAELSILHKHFSAVFHDPSALLCHATHKLVQITTAVYGPSVRSVLLLSGKVPGLGGQGLLPHQPCPSATVPFVRVSSSEIYVFMLLSSSSITVGQSTSGHPTLNRLSGRSGARAGLSLFDRVPNTIVSDDFDEVSIPSLYASQHQAFSWVRSVLF